MVGGMVAMAHTIDGGEYLTVSEAVGYIGCTEGWIRKLLRAGDMPGRRVGLRVWLIPVEAADKARAALTTRSIGKKHLAARPVSARKKAAKRPKQ